MIAKKYAKAFFSVTQELKNTDEVYNAIQNFITNIYDGFNELLINPLLLDLEKEQIISTSFPDFYFYSKNFLKVLLRNKRISFLIPILKQYVNLYKKYNEISTVDIWLSYEPDETIKKLISNKLKNQMNKKVLEFNFHKNSSLIGGFLVKIDKHFTYDNSIMKKLSNMHKVLIE